jgi:hypothetical protein
VNLQNWISPDGEDGHVSWWSIYSAGEQSGAEEALRWHHRPRYLEENREYNRTYLALTEEESSLYHAASKILDDVTSQARDALQAGDFDEAVRCIEAARDRIAAEVGPGWQEPTARCFAAGAELDRRHAETKAAAEV